MFYLKSDISFEIVSKRWGLFTSLGGIVYLYHLFWTISGVDKYADNTRNLQCDGLTYGAGDESSSILDGAILAVTIFHMIEWVRWTAYLTMALVSVNLFPFYNVLSLNIIYGLFALIYGIMAAMGEDGAACGDSHQPERFNFLNMQILCLILWIPFCFAHPLFLKIRGRDWCHATWLMEEDEGEED